LKEPLPTLWVPTAVFPAKDSRLAKTNITLTPYSFSKKNRTTEGKGKGWENDFGTIPMVGRVSS